MSRSILHVTPVTDAGDIPIFIRRQILGLSKNGYNNSVVRLRGSAGVRHPTMLAREVHDLRTAIKHERPTLVHAHWGSILGYLTTTLAHYAHIPSIVTFRGSDLNPVVSESASTTWIRNRLSQTAARKSARVICVSQQLADRIDQPPTAPVIVIDGVELAVFRPEDNLEAREQLGWDKETWQVFFYQGGRPVEKGRPLVDEALALCETRGFNCNLQVVESNLERSEVALRMNAADAVIVASRSEGSPNIVREAIACHTPVVTVEVGDVRRWVQPGYGQVVSRNGFELARALIEECSRVTRPNPSSEILSAMSEDHSLADLMRVYDEVCSIQPPDI